jgi:hypothetical protein
MRWSLVLSLGLCTAVGCAPVAAQYELDYQLGDASVRVDATLHDLRVSEDDELVAFRQVMSFSSPERARTLLELQDERLELERYELFANRDGGLDLRVALRLSREDFERCVMQPRGACDLLSLTRLDGGAWAPRGPNDYEVRKPTPTGWPATATALRLALQAPAKVLNQPSALDIWQRAVVHLDAPALDDWMQRVDDAFVGWEGLTEFPSPPTTLDSSELRVLAERFLVRKRLHLLTMAAADARTCAGPEKLHTRPFETMCDLRMPGSGPPERQPFFRRPPGRKALAPLQRALAAAHADPEHVSFTAACKGARGEVAQVCRLLLGK